MMANSMSGLGAPRTPRAMQHFSSDMLSAPFPSPLFDGPVDGPASDLSISRSSRNEPTALSHNRKGYRKGAEAPEKSSLPFFVFIGLVVGLFAFGMMSFCLPDPFEKIAAREAAAAQTFPPPPPIPATTNATTNANTNTNAPAVAAEPVPSITVPTQVTVTTITPAAKQARVVRRHVVAPKKPASTGAKLPSNPYGDP